MKVIIPTRGRAAVIGKKALRLFPDATLCVGADEVDAYAPLSDRLLVHPAEVAGIGPLRRPPQAANEDWWRRWESNPRPDARDLKLLRE